jgi:hypothetical protein
MTTNRHIFRQAVLGALLPVLRAKGFEQWKPKVRAEAPIGHLRRQIAKRTDLLDIQFDKHGRLGCFLNLAQIQRDEVATLYEGMLPADQITTAHLNERCRLRGNSFFGMFKPPLFLRVFGPERLGRAVAEQILSKFPGAEDWFTTKRPGKHIECNRL